MFEKQTNLMGLHGFGCGGEGGGRLAPESWKIVNFMDLHCFRSGVVGGSWHQNH